MPTYQCKLYEVDENAPRDEKPKALKPFSVNAPDADRGLKAARKYQRDRGRVVRGANITHNRFELVVYVYKDRPKNMLEPKTVRLSDLEKGA